MTSKVVSGKLWAAIKASQGDPVAKFFNIKYLLQNRVICSNLVEENAFSHIPSPLWSEIFSKLFQTCLFPDTASQISIFGQVVLLILRSSSDIPAALLHPILRASTKTLKYFAHSECSESLRLLQKIFPITVKPKNQEDLLCVTNAILSSFFLLNNFKQCEAVIKTVNQTISGSIKSYQPHERSEYFFFCGRVKAIQRESKKAVALLIGSLSLIPSSSVEDIRLVLAYLVPAQLHLGVVPKIDILTEYHLERYAGLVGAVLTGSITTFNECIEDYQILFIKLGVFELVMGIRRIVMRRILEMAYLCWGDIKMPTTIFQKVVNQQIQFGIDEAEYEIAQLIEEGLVKAYISRSHHMIVFSKADPFPELPLKEESDR